jgi:hypothetical protein
VSPRRKADAAVARMGRPPLVAGETKGRMFTLRLSSAEREAIELAAIRAGATSASEWARATLLAAARVLLEVS